MANNNVQQQHQQPQFPQQQLPSLQQQQQQQQPQQQQQQQHLAQQPQQQQQQQHIPQQNSPHHCKECGLYLNSAESLDVHLQYHKENLLTKWATQAPLPNQEETNNNTPKNSAIKREFLPNSVSVAADSSDSLKKSPEYGNRATPETFILGHPPTPQSYHSASSPYQSADNATFSPGFQNYQPIKTERSSPINNFSQQPYTANYSDNQFFNLDNSAPPPQQQYQNYPQEHPLQQKINQQNSFRYHPYHGYERANISSNSAFPPQPTPSPSPKQCDKCGYVCESASQLNEHLNMAHPPTPAPHLAPYQQQNHFMFGGQEIKSEDNAQSEILDLDSHKVHQVYPEENKRQNGELTDPNVHAQTLFSWHEQRLYDQKMYRHSPQVIGNDFLNGVPSQDTGGMVNQQVQQSYRAFEHLPPQPVAPVISSTQVPNTPSSTPVQPPTKNTNWKSNEARRPKTYNCTACNKWFTSSGHLKRHYNTTLHKNAVKSSNQPDPATMPISAHHHPARESATSKDDRNSSSPQDDSRGEDSLLGGGFDRVMPSNGPYDRQPGPPNILHPPMHSPGLTNLSAGSPPNGEAGPSATNLDSRGLLSINNSPTANNSTGFSMAPMMPMDNSQFPMYPNASAPHVTQATDINSLNTTGEYHQEHQFSPENDPQPLPSFAQFTAHRFGMMLGPISADVGGLGPVTAPYTYYTECYDLPEARAVICREENEEYKLTVMTTAQPALEAESEICEPTTSVGLVVTSNIETHPASPENAHLQRDLEENSSPHVSSTVNKQAVIHKCFDCDKIFNKSCYLTQHNKTFHDGDRPFKCSRCGKRFPTERIIEEHERKHGGDKPHKCEICPKQFNHKTDLRRHMCLHTGNKPYSCSTCGKGFIRKDHMLKHCETHLRRSKMPTVRSS